MKKIVYSILIGVVMFTAINLCYYKVYGTEQQGSTPDDIITGAQSFLNAGKDTQINEDNLKDTSNYIYNLLLAIALIVAVIVGIILGMQFMMASVEEKAKVKEALIPYVTGCVVVFGAFAIWKIAVIALSRL